MRRPPLSAALLGVSLALAAVGCAWADGLDLPGLDSESSEFAATLAKPFRAGGTPDGNVLDCAGSPVPQPLLPSAANDAATVYSRARAYNVLFVEADVDGEPALKCKRQTYDASGNPSVTDTTNAHIVSAFAFQGPTEKPFEPTHKHREPIPQTAP